MTLIVQWLFFDPFGQCSRVLNNLPVNYSQCPFIPMTDTDVTFLSCYTIVGRTRMHVTFLSCYNIVGSTRMHVCTSFHPFSPLDSPIWWWWWWCLLFVLSETKTKNLCSNWFSTHTPYSLHRLLATVLAMDTTVDPQGQCHCPWQHWCSVRAWPARPGWAWQTVSSLVRLLGMLNVRPQVGWAAPGPSLNPCLSWAGDPPPGPTLAPCCTALATYTASLRAGDMPLDCVFITAPLICFEMDFPAIRVDFWYQNWSDF
jgi:hypothetical protein